MKIGDTMTVDGYTVKMEASFNEEWSVYIGFMSVRADASTNTEMVWNGTLSDAAMAIRYVNDLAAGDGQTINLGAAMENAGGNGVNYVGGVVATGAIVTDATPTSTAAPQIRQSAAAGSK